MNVKYFSLFRAAGLFAATLFATSVFAADAAKPESDAIALDDGENYIKLGGTYANFDGEKAASQARTQIPDGLSGGIESLRFTQELDKTTTLLVDGKALPGAEDYLLSMRVSRNEVGSFETGYKTFRTFYDGAGGFFPVNKAWLPIYPRAIFTDRGKFWATATISLPKEPVYTFNYVNETRTGRKDSTIWGDTDFTGIPIYSNSALNPVSANRKIIPAYIELNERRERWDASFRHNIASTRIFLQISGDNIDNLNTRSVDRYPGELRPFPAIPANPPVLVPPQLANNEVRGTDKQGVKQDSLTYMGKVTTALSNSVDIFVEGNYRSGDGDTVGSRLLTGKLQTLVGVASEVGIFTPGGRPPYSYNSTGTLEFDVMTLAVGTEARLTPDLRLTAALKYEDYSSKANSSVAYVSTMVNQTTGVVTPVPLNTKNSSAIDEEVWVPEVEVRYSGIRNLALYGSFDYRDAPGDERASYQGITTSPGGPVVIAPTVTATDNTQETHYNFTVGANWMVSKGLSLRGEVFSKDHQNDFEGYGTHLGAYYRLAYDTTGARLTADWKASQSLSFKTRYVYTKVKGSMVEDGFLEGDTNDTVRHHIGETVDWNPNKLFYMQLNLNVVFDVMSTAYPKAGGSANDVLRNSDNNFWNGSLITGWVVDKVTDAQLVTTYYEADNYEPRQIATDPYGMGCRDWAVYVGLKRKFSNRVIGHAKAGYMESRNDTTGGNSDFKGPLAYLALECRL